MVIDFESRRQARDLRRANRSVDPSAAWIALPYLMIAASIVVAAYIFSPQEWK